MDITDFTQYPTGNLCNANPSVKTLPSAIRPLIPGLRIAGPARTARVKPGHNAAIHRAVHHAQPGEVLIVDGDAAEQYGTFGDLLADFCKARKMSGAVLNCTMRDSADVRALGFQVFSRGFHPAATQKTDPGEVDIPVTIGGVTVTPGDIIVGDDDGVVVIPAGLADHVLEQVSIVAGRETQIRARILAGESTCDIFDIDHAGNKGEPESKA